jgi:hypothetical protein
MAAGYGGQRPRLLRLAAVIGAVILLPALSSLFWLFVLVFHLLSSIEANAVQQLWRSVKRGRKRKADPRLLASLCLALTAGSLFKYQWPHLSRVDCGIVVVFIVIQTLLPAVAIEQSYKSSVEAIERNYSGSQPCTCFPRIDYTSIVFYGGESLQLSEDAKASSISLSGRGLCHRGRKRIKRSHSSLYLAPLLRSKGTGPDRDNPLILVRGTKG